jgi:hypothetical protein
VAEVDAQRDSELSKRRRKAGLVRRGRCHKNSMGLERGYRLPLRPRDRWEISKEQPAGRP